MLKAWPTVCSLLLAAALLTVGLLLPACGPECNSSAECETGFVCFNQACEKRRTYPPLPNDSYTGDAGQEAGSDGLQGDSGTPDPTSGEGAGDRHPSETAGDAALPDPPTDSGSGPPDTVPEVVTDPGTNADLGPPDSPARPPRPGELVINEVLADPAAGAAGDANRDNVRDAEDDEFVELANASSSVLDLAGVEIWDGIQKRYTFLPGTTLQPGAAVVVFGGQDTTVGTGIPGSVDNGVPNYDFCGAQVYLGKLLGLSNSSDTVIVKGAGGSELARLEWGGTTGIQGSKDQSMTRSPDMSGSFVLHETAAPGVAFSPGCKVDGTRF